MGKYRKKSIVVDAWECSLYCVVPRWVLDGFASGVLSLNTENIKYLKKQHLEIKIKTLEGEMLANLGDYIIKGVRGELYPCKSDIFKATYENVADDENADSKRNN